MVEKLACRSCDAEILPSTAERTGGVCMRCHAQGPPVPSEVVRRARETPARCLAGFCATLNPTLAAPSWDTLETVRFHLACPCGNAALRVLGYNVIHEDSGVPIFAAPLAAACPDCGEATELFDPRQDGYDGEIGSSAGIVGAGQREPFGCPACDGQAFAVEALLYYSLDDSEMEEWKELAERPQDFFTWISVDVACEQCGEQTKVVGYECA